MQARATWDEVGLLLPKESWSVTLLVKNVDGGPVCWFCWIVFACCCRGCRGGGGGSVLNYSVKDEWCVDVVAVVSSVHACCCWFGWRCRGDRDRGPCWLFESATHKVAFNGFSFQAVLCRSEPGHVVCEIVVVAVHIICFDVVFPYLGCRPPFLIDAALEMMILMRGAVPANASNRIPWATSIATSLLRTNRPSAPSFISSSH